MMNAIDTFAGKKLIEKIRDNSRLHIATVT